MTDRRERRDRTYRIYAREKRREKRYKIEAREKNEKTDNIEERGMRETR